MICCFVFIESGWSGIFDTELLSKTSILFICLSLIFETIQSIKLEWLTSLWFSGTAHSVGSEQTRFWSNKSYISRHLIRQNKYFLNVCFPLLRGPCKVHNRDEPGPSYMDKTASALGIVKSELLWVGWARFTVNNGKHGRAIGHVHLSVNGILFNTELFF